MERDIGPVAEVEGWRSVQGKNNRETMGSHYFLERETE
jgi:hypothetical protein